MPLSHLNPTDNASTLLMKYWPVCMIAKLLHSTDISLEISNIQVNQNRHNNYANRNKQKTKQKAKQNEVM